MALMNEYEHIGTDEEFALKLHIADAKAESDICLSTENGV